MMPGASARPSAFTVSLATPSLPPTAAIFPPVTPRSPRTGALPAPSWISASLMTRSNILAPSDFRHGVTPRQPFPGPLALNKAMSDANDEALLSRLVVALAPVPGIDAIALGGSRACGTATAASDYDIGLYYRGRRPIDIVALSKVAPSPAHPGAAAEVTPLGGWGPWIDGGGWLLIGGIHVDLLYRDLDRVATAIDDAHAGKIEPHYQPGHPHAFLPTIYVGEAAYARPLHDPAGSLAALQARTTPYPPALAAALHKRFAWEASFALANARKSLDRGDVSYLAGCAFRAVPSLRHVLV